MQHINQNAYDIYFFVFISFLFRSFDDNNDGSIDMKEMKKFVKDITVLLSPSELETIQEEDGINVAFSEMDKIMMEEYLRTNLLQLYWPKKKLEPC